MSKKPSPKPAPRNPVTREAVARTMKTVGSKHGGQVPAGSYVGALQAAEASRNREPHKIIARKDKAPATVRQLQPASKDNRSRQLNSQHDTYWKSRGQPERPFGLTRQLRIKTGI